MLIICYVISTVFCLLHTNVKPIKFSTFSCFFLLSLAIEDSFWREKAIELHIKTELLEERVVFLRKALEKLDKKLRKFQNRHVDCFPRKTVFLFR